MRYEKLMAALARVAALLLALAAVVAVPATAAPRMDRLTIVVPGAPGGGWDLTAKAMKAALEGEGIVGQVGIVRYPGTGGLVGLSEFVNRHHGQGDVLLIGGLAMLGAAVTDQAAISIRDVAPVARLTGDWGVIAVRADSPIRSLADLKRAMLTRANSLRWTGGSLGSADQALVWSMAAGFGVPLDDVLYYGKVGGRHAAEALADGRADVAVSGYAEFRPYLSQGRFRVVAVSSPRRIAGIAAPTLAESGVAVSIMNWRGVFAAPGLSTAQQERLAGVVRAMQATRGWRRALVEARWSDAFLDADAFSAFIDRETTRWPTLVNPPARGVDAPVIADDGGATGRWLSILLVPILIGAVVPPVAMARRRRAEVAALESRCGDLQVRLNGADAAKSSFVLAGIEDDFGEWKLSDAERDIAWFMLRGLPLKQIAGLRGTSERTVRQQAQAIYRKAGLESRSDLAGRVLERFI